MEEQIKEMLIKLEFLEKLINTVQQNLNLTWAILGVIVGILAFTSFFLIKSIVNERVEKELVEIKHSLKNELINELTIDIKEIIATKSEGLKNELYLKLKTDLSLELLDYINRTKSIFWASGNGTQPYERNGIYILDIYGLNMSSECEKTIINVELKSSVNGRKINCDYNPYINKSNNLVEVNLLDYNKEKDGQVSQWKVVWINGKL